MSKVLWHITMSLDGFIAPRDYLTGSAPVKLRKTRCDDAGQITDLGYEVLR